MFESFIIITLRYLADNTFQVFLDIPPDMVENRKQRDIQSPRQFGCEKMWKIAKNAKKEG